MFILSKAVKSIYSSQLMTLRHDKLAKRVSTIPKMKESLIEFESLYCDVMVKVAIYHDDPVYGMTFLQKYSFFQEGKFV